MLKNAVAVLDVGSSKVTAIIGENAVNNNYMIRALNESSHEAFYDGQISDEKSLQNAVISSIKGVCASARATISELYVGVPGEFLKIANRQHKILLNRKRRIKKNDVEELYLGAQESINEPGWTIIDKSAVYYFIDGNTRVADPQGKVSDSINGYLSFFLCKNSFIDKMNEILSQLKINKVHFVPIPLCQSLFLFSREERYAYEILIDVGYITTSVSIVLGDGLLYQGSFPMGGGHITAYLSNSFNTDFSLAEMLKRKVNLSVNALLQPKYDVFVSDERYQFDVKQCNDVVFGVIDGIAEKIELCLRDSMVRLPEGNISVSLTGGGLCFMRGAREYLSKRIEKVINVVAPSIPFMNKPDESSKLALLDYSLNYKQKNK